MTRHRPGRRERQAMKLAEPELRQVHPDLAFNAATQATERIDLVDRGALPCEQPHTYTLERAARNRNASG